jgi:sugar lactone lactonase YvrE
MPGTEPLVGGLDHPEGVCWDPGAGVLWAGGEAGQLYCVDVETRTWKEVARAPGFVHGLAVDAQGRVAICCGADGLLCVLRGRRVRVLKDGIDFPNYPAFASDGTLYLSASGSWAANDGRVHRLASDGTLDVLTDRLHHFPNGCAVDAEDRWLWIVESYEPTVNRIDLESGEIDEITRLEGTVPDGVAFTADGGLLVSCYRPDRIVHIGRDGRVETVAEDPQGTHLAAPTNVAFFGAELDRLVSANLGRWHLTLVETELRGMPLHRPERWAADA